MGGAVIYDGVAQRSRYRPDPPIHILVGDRYEVWCSGGPGLRENTPNRLRCPRCTAPLREGVAEEMYDQRDLDDWLASTRSKRVFGVGRGREKVTGPNEH